MDSNGALFATFKNDNYKILKEFTAPKRWLSMGGRNERKMKHNEEIKLKFTVSTATTCSELFKNVDKIVIAGNGDYTDNVYECPQLQKEIKDKVITLLDIVYYGGELGLKIAIESYKKNNEPKN